MISSCILSYNSSPSTVPQWPVFLRCVSTHPESNPQACVCVCVCVSVWPLSSH